MHNAQPATLTLWQMVRALFDGLILRCPRCHRGPMFRGWTMHLACPNCGQVFESASGEVTGGMGINTVATLFLVIVAAGASVFLTKLPVWPLIGVMALITVAFAIGFYRSSRGLWASILFITGDNSEDD